MRCRPVGLLKRRRLTELKHSRLSMLQPWVTLSLSISNGQTAGPVLDHPGLERAARPKGSHHRVRPAVRSWHRGAASASELVQPSGASTASPQPTSGWRSASASNRSGSAAPLPCRRQEQVLLLGTLPQGRARHLRRVGLRMSAAVRWRHCVAAACVKACAPHPLRFRLSAGEAARC